MLKRLLLRCALLGCPLLAQSQAVAPLAPRQAQVVLPADSLRLPALLVQPRYRTYCPILTTLHQEDVFYGVPNLEPLLSRIVGTQVTPYSGAPGALQVVRLRGANVVVVSGYRGFDPNVSSGGSGGGSAGLDVSAYPVPRTWLLGMRVSL